MCVESGCLWRFSDWVWSWPDAVDQARRPVVRRLSRLRSVSAPATPVKPAALTGATLCGLLGPGDLGSLVYGDTTGGPSAESSGGLAGCR